MGSRSGDYADANGIVRKHLQDQGKRFTIDASASMACLFACPVYNLAYRSGLSVTADSMAFTVAIETR